MSKQRRKFSEEFKLDAVRLVFEEKIPASQVAKNLGIGSSTLSGWLKKLSPKYLASQGIMSSEQEIRELKKKLREAEMERDILKKATAFFAKKVL